MVPVRMRYAVRIVLGEGAAYGKASAFAKATADGPAVDNLSETTRSRGSATLHELRVLRAFVVNDGDLTRKTDGTTEIPRQARGDSGKVRPSQTQSHLVKPSPTLNFPRTDRIWRKTRKIAQSVPLSLFLLTTSHWPLATTAPAQYGLIRPNTALNTFCERGPIRLRQGYGGLAVAIFDHFRVFEGRTVPCAEQA